jgi:glycosyltransferase involved in cell wall biosynthesis
MRILVVGPSPKKIGGIATLNQQLLDVAPVEGDFLFNLDLIQHGWISFPFHLLRAIFIQRDFDVIHIQMSSKGSCLRKVILRVLCIKPVVIEIHGSKFAEFSDTLLGRLLFKILKIYQDRYLVLNHELKTKLSKMGISNITVVSNCANEPTYFGEREFSDGTVNSSRRKKAIYIGRISEEKGIDLMFEGWSQICTSSWDLEVYGPVNPKYDKKFRELLSVHRNVSYRGTLANKDVYQHIAESELFLLASYFEGQPVSLIEAMACGKPFLASDLPGIKRLDPDNEFSFQFKKGDLSDFTSKLILATSSLKRLRHMGKKARARYLKFHTPSIYYQVRKEVWEYERNR